MLRATLTASACLAIGILSTPATATELLPGETLSLDSVSLVGSVQTVVQGAAGGLFIPPTNNPLVQYGVFSAEWVHSSPSDPLQLYYDYNDAVVIDPVPGGTAPVTTAPPGNATISIAGFRSLSIDVAEFPDIYSTPIRAISRSADGDIITLSGFDAFSINNVGHFSPGIVLTIPNASVISSTATLDLQNGQTFSVDSFAAAPDNVGALPEPASLALLPLALSALAVRARR